MSIKPETAERMKLGKIKQRAIDLITECSILSDDISKIIVDFLDIAPTNIKQEWIESREYNKHREALQSKIDDNQLKWVITENYYNDEDDKFGGLGPNPIVHIENITAIYYYQPKYISKTHDEKYIIIGKCKWSLTQWTYIVEKELSLHAHLAQTVAKQKNDEAITKNERHSVKKNENQRKTLVAEYGDEIDVYFMLYARELYTLSNISAGFMGQKIIFSSTWNDVYYYGLDSDLLRDECHRNHWFD